MPKEVLNLAEGPVVFGWPDRISPASLQEVQNWLARLLSEIEGQVRHPVIGFEHDDYEGGE